MSEEATALERARWIRLLMPGIPTDNKELYKLIGELVDIIDDYKYRVGTKQLVLKGKSKHRVMHGFNNAQSFIKYYLWQIGEGESFWFNTSDFLYPPMKGLTPQKSAYKRIIKIVSRINDSNKRKFKLDSVTTDWSKIRRII